MQGINEAARPSGIGSLGNDDDERLFESSFTPRQTSEILRIKQNDRSVKSFCVAASFFASLDVRVWRRIGYILRQNTNVKYLSICGGGNVDVVGLCGGLQHNRSIHTLSLCGIETKDIFISLVPFLSNNSSLKEIILESCKIETTAMEIFSNALSNRSSSIEQIALGRRNTYGNGGLDQFILALKRGRNLTRLALFPNTIGQKESFALAKLLEDRQSILERLDLGNNSLNDESCIILADSLVDNTKLEKLHLGRHEGITIAGWLKLLSLFGNGSSINDVLRSNHTVWNLGMQDNDCKNSACSALGVNSFNMLEALLRLNCVGNKRLVARFKIILNHAQGNLNLGDSSLATGAMMIVLGWFCDAGGYYEVIQSLIQNSSIPLQDMRLDSIYCIVRSRPDLC